MGMDPGNDFLAQTCKELHEHFGIEHATLQVEIGDPNHPCALAIRSPMVAAV